MLRQWKLIVAIGMFLAFIAGTLIGVGGTRLHSRSADDFGPPGFGGPPEMRLSEQLNLSPDQQNQMRDIWEKLMQDGPALDQQQRDLHEKYRDSFLSLLTPDQKQKYDAFQSDYQRELTQLDTTRRNNFLAAIEKTKSLLTPEQREKYEQIMSRHGGPFDEKHGPGPHHGPHGDQAGDLFAPPMIAGPNPHGDHGPPSEQ